MRRALTLAVLADHLKSDGRNQRDAAIVGPADIFRPSSETAMRPKADAKRISIALLPFQDGLVLFDLDVARKSQ